MARRWSENCTIIQINAPYIINHFSMNTFSTKREWSKWHVNEEKRLLFLPFECRTEGTLIELGKCDSDITRPDTGAAQRLRLESVKQTKISVFSQIQRRICITGEDYSPSVGIHENGEICYTCICQNCDFCCIVNLSGQKAYAKDIHVHVLVNRRFIWKVILKKISPFYFSGEKM